MLVALLTMPLLTTVDSDLFAWWHQYRVPLIFAAAIVYGLYSSYQKFCSRAKRQLNTSELKAITPETLASDAREKPSIIALSPETISKGPKRIMGNARKQKESGAQEIAYTKLQVLLFFSSITSTTEQRARQLTHRHAESLAATQKSPNKLELLPPMVLDLAEIDFDDYFLATPKSTGTLYFYMILIPSYNIDTIMDNYLEHLRETHNDFRIDTAPLSGILGYSVFGFGDREGWPTEEEGFCSQATDTDKWMAKLTGRKRAFPLGMGDSKSDVESRLEEWGTGVLEVIQHLAAEGNLGEGVPGSGDAVESGDEDVDEDVSVDKKTRADKKATSLNDVEDIGGSLSNLPNDLETDFTTSISGKPVPIVKEMVPKASPTYNALTKQGYSIVGSHSGVKICRWTKSALRGRGSCYKYSFYGIASHRCMETTPSLSCSNKCVFCWRHGTNPVGTTWRWVVDPPDLIFKGVKEQHYMKIKSLRGVPGVRAERFAEAMRIRHCALSLVGEPIFYPHINEFVAMLHAEHISSFIVCNAQHPDQLATLKHVTQLYVSIDASNRESLRRIDRPLHRDFWERFQRCLDILRERRFEQRTVFRLTLVKGFNIDDEVLGYADLVAKGLPCFIEIKGVTYCGTSTSAGAGLTMQNVPFYEEVCTFVRALDAELARRGLGYGIAAEHAHSCCVLLASERFRHPETRRWCTRIDYEAFFRCLESGKAFTPEDYMGEETPEWALWGNGGFDPRDERVYRKKSKKPPVEQLEF